MVLVNIFLIIYDDLKWSRYMIMMYDDHVWWSYMMIIHEFIYDDHTWSLYIIILYDHPIWSWDMMIIYDHHTWSSYTRMIYDHHTCSSYMMIIYDHHTWSSFMIIIHDHHESIRVTCFKRGVAYSMEKYLEVIRTEKISIFAPITFIPCSECTPEEKKIQTKKKKSNSSNMLDKMRISARVAYTEACPMLIHPVGWFLNII